MSSNPVPDPGLVARLDPALRHLATARTNLSADVRTTVRDSLNQRRRETARSVDLSGVDVTDEVIAGVGVRIYRGGVSSAVLYCHSGGFVLGNLDTDHLQCVEWAREAQCTVVSVDYRLAPEHPYPAAFDDVSTILRWATEVYGRVAVAGSSAGGALAALLAQEVPEVVFQMLHQPVLDDRPTPSKREFVATPGFDGPAAEQMWRHYGVAGERAVPAYSEDLSCVAPGLMTCSELDPLRDEAVDYATRLMRAGVAVELHVFAGTCHGFDSLVPDWEISRDLFAMQSKALSRAFGAELRSRDASLNP